MQALLIYVICFAAGLFLGSVLIWVYWKTKYQSTQEKLDLAQSQQEQLRNELQEEKNQHRISLDRLSLVEKDLVKFQTISEKDQQKFEENLKIIENLKSQIQSEFKVLSSQALKENQESFLHLAQENLEKFHIQAKDHLEQKKQSIEHLVHPIKDSLMKFEKQVQEIETKREGAYENLIHQVQFLHQSNQALKTETNNLVHALKTPRIRGRWGEIQLKKIVEVAGMVNHCDFVEQAHKTIEEGSNIRPDMVIQLPGNKNIVVDAKTPLESYIESFETDDENIKKEKLAAHARHVKAHVQALSRKSYWQNFQPSPEFVLLYLPGDMIYYSALQEDPTLIESSAKLKVMIATPTSFLTMLRAVAMSWKEVETNQNAAQIAILGKELYERLQTLSKYFNDVGSKLSQTVGSYNKALRSFESRALVSARKFHQLQHEEKVEFDSPSPVDQSPLSLHIGAEE
ncbi:MAG: DNA recombination protein RmuC [Bdellovibrionales bacterium]|nr:DNA recombination protein RmuC [Bdellovibrionales bacterium]